MLGTRYIPWEKNMIVAANWKMNPDLATASGLVASYVRDDYPSIQRILFPPHPYLVPMGVRLQDSQVQLGGQDCHAKPDGAHTGDVSAQMLASCGVNIVLLGHSERRDAHGETDADIKAKATSALAVGLNVMICVGEQADQREQGQALDVVANQLAGSIPNDVSAARLSVAYEPVWAIGTGKVATTNEIAEMHQHIHTKLAARNLAQVAILYGGSVKPDNAADIFAIPHVGGALVGGASLDADQFSQICAAAAR